jgi:hypothetical protein
MRPILACLIGPGANSIRGERFLTRHQIRSPRQSRRPQPAIQEQHNDGRIPAGREVGPGRRASPDPGEPSSGRVAGVALTECYQPAPDVPAIQLGPPTSGCCSASQSDGSCRPLSGHGALCFKPRAAPLVHLRWSAGPRAGPQLVTRRPVRWWRRRRRRGRGQTMTPTGNRLDRFIREPRTEPRMVGMRGVRAPTVEPRTPRTPL